MNIYRTEIEQTEIIKKWFQKHGYWLSCTVLVILLIVAGYRLWENHTLKISAQASERYQQMMAAVANDDPSLISAQADDLIKNYSGTVYAEIAGLTQAKIFVSEKKWGEALSQLDKVIKNAKNPALRQIARLRSARILCTLNTPDDYRKALSLLEIIDDTAYLPAIDEMKGDIYVGLNDQKQARLFYLEAKKAFSKADLGSPFLAMKLNNISDENE